MVLTAPHQHISKCFVQIIPKAFSRNLQKACPLKIQKLLTDNGKEFTDRLFANREKAPSGTREFDQLCQQFGIAHRLRRPRTPETKGMVERFNGRIADMLKTTGSRDERICSRRCCAT